MDTLSKGNLLKFIDYAIQKGLVKANTGNGWKAACSKILEAFGHEDDLSAVDVPSEVLRYNNRHPGVLSPDSLNQYQKRVVLVLGEFGKFLANPTTYKGVSSRPSTNGKPLEKRKVEVKANPEAVPLVAEAQPSTHRHVTSAVTETSLMMPFPLRPTFFAQIIIPRDLTKDEASRLCTFIQALAHDAPAT